MALTSTAARSIMFRRQDSLSKLQCETTPVVSIAEEEAPQGDPGKPNRRTGMKKSLSLFFRKKANRLLPRSRSALTLEDTASVTSDQEESEDDGRTVRFAKQGPQVTWVPSFRSWPQDQRQRAWYPADYVLTQKAEANQAAHFQGNANPQWTASLDAVYKQALYWAVTTQSNDERLCDAKALNRACRPLLTWHKRIAMAQHYEEASSFRGLEDWVNHSYRGDRHAAARESVRFVASSPRDTNPKHLARDYHELTRSSVLWARLFAQADALDVQETSGSEEFSQGGNESSGELSTTDIEEGPGASQEAKL